MNLWDYAMARAWRQLSDLAAERPLTPGEASMLAVCGRVVKRYEEQETHADPA